MKIVFFSNTHLTRIAGDFVHAGFRDTTALKLNQFTYDNLLHMDADMVVLFLDSHHSGILARLKEIRAKRPLPVVVFCDSSDAVFIEQAVDGDADSVVINGYSAMRIKSIVDVAMKRFNHFDGLHRELARTKTKLSELVLTNKAKGLLMRERGIGEEEALQVLRTMAAHRRKSLGEVAKDLVAMSGMLNKTPGKAMQPFSGNRVLGGNFPKETV